MIDAAGYSPFQFQSALLLSVIWLDQILIGPTVRFWLFFVSPQFFPHVVYMDMSMYN